MLISLRNEMINDYTAIDVLSLKGQFLHCYKQYFKTIDFLPVAIQKNTHSRRHHRQLRKFITTPTPPPTQFHRERASLTVNTKPKTL